jgi:PAS domain S-box-containing protein
MHKPPRSTLVRYGLVPVAVASALLLRVFLWPLVGTELPFLLLWPAVTLCAWYGGFGPGFLATLLSAIAAHVFLLEPRLAFALSDPNGVVGMGLFLLLGLSTSLLSERLRQANRRVEEHAQEVFNQREWLRVTLGSIGDGVIATDTQGRVTFLNSVAQSLTGWSQDEAAGLPMETVFRILNEQTRQPVDNPVRKVLQTDAIVGLANHTVLLARNGPEKPIDDSAAPIRSDADKTLGVVLVFRDVTERRRLENEVQHRMDDLAEADRHKNQFLAMLAHELRNPLAPACSALALLQRLSPEDPNFQSAKEILDRQLRQIGRLVDDLLDVSRISTGKIRLRKAAVELHDIVERAVEISRPLIEARRHELMESLPNEPLWLQADATRLAQVLSNLLNNAAKYTPEGGQIRLTTKRECNTILVQVRDTGIGIAAEMLPRVFDLFTQADRSLDRSQGGLGIGLTLVRRLVEMHGGQVRASSPGPGRGSKFEVWLPIGEKQPESPPHRGQEEDVQGATARRILLVDDNRDAAQSLSVLLRAAGHDVCLAHDGPSALALAGTVQPEVVLLDIGLPGMDGYEVARRLRRLSGLEKVLLVALTGYGQEEDRWRSCEAGFDRHLVKPVDLDTLQALLKCPKGTLTLT